MFLQDLGRTVTLREFFSEARQQEVVVMGYSSEFSVANVTNVNRQQVTKSFVRILC